MLKAILYSLCILRGALAGIGLSVVLLVILINLPSEDSTGVGAYFIYFLFMAPVLSVIGAVGEIVALAIGGDSTP